MSLSAQELSFLNAVGPRPAINKMGLLKFVSDVYPEQGMSVFEKKLLTKRKVKTKIIVTSLKVQEAMIKRLFDGELEFKKIGAIAWSENYAPALKKVESFNAFREKNDSLSLVDFILEAIKEGDHSEMFREDWPFTVQYQKGECYFEVNQETPEFDEYETSHQQEERLINIFNSYFHAWTTKLDKYRDLLKTLKGMEESVGLDAKIKDKIISNYLDSLQTPSHAEQFKDKITLREFVLKYA